MILLKRLHEVLHQPVYFPISKLLMPKSHRQTRSFFMAELLAHAFETETTSHQMDLCDCLLFDRIVKPKHIDFIMSFLSETLLKTGV